MHLDGTCISPFLFSLDCRPRRNFLFFGWTSVPNFCCVSLLKSLLRRSAGFPGDNGKAVRIDPWTTDQQLLDGQLSRGYHKSPKRGNSSMYEDKTLVCKECGNEFVFTAGEQEFYAERGFQNEPQRCKACRDARKNAARGPRQYFTAVCAACGGEAKVPFEPKSDRPVYCSECFAKMHNQEG